MYKELGDGRWSISVGMMMFSHHVHTAITSLFSEKQRTFLALLGIVIGIASVISMVSIAIISNEEMLSKYDQLGTDLIGVGINTNYYGDDFVTDDVIIPVSTVLALPSVVSAVKDIAPLLDHQVSYLFMNEDARSDLYGVTESFQRVYGLSLKEGRFISDFDKNKPFVVLGSDFLLEDSFQNFKGSLLGALMTIDGYPMRIVGVLNPASPLIIAPSFHRHVNRALFMHISNMQRYPNKNIKGMMLRLNSDKNISESRQQIEQFFYQRFRSIDVKVQSSEVLIKKKEADANLNMLQMMAIGSIALLVAGVGIMNVMLTSVTERRKEIGVLRAIGARQSDIRWQFFTEAIILSFIGGILGILLGILSAYIYAMWNEMTFFISGMAVLIGIGVSISVGTFFGFYPAYKAAKLDPIKALR